MISFKKKLLLLLIGMVGMLTTYNVSAMNQLGGFGHNYNPMINNNYNPFINNNNPMINNNYGPEFNTNDYNKEFNLYEDAVLPYEDDKIFETKEHKGKLKAEDFVRYALKINGIEYDIENGGYYYNTKERKYSDSGEMLTSGRMKEGNLLNIILDTFIKTNANVTENNLKKEDGSFDLYEYLLFFKNDFSLSFRMNDNAKYELCNKGVQLNPFYSFKYGNDYIKIDTAKELDRIIKITKGELNNVADYNSMAPKYKYAYKMFLIAREFVRMLNEK